MPPVAANWNVNGVPTTPVGRGDGVVSVSVPAGFTVSENGAEMEPPFASTTTTVNAYVPLDAGMPEIVPLGPLEHPRGQGTREGKLIWRSSSGSKQLIRILHVH